MSQCDCTLLQLHQEIIAAKDAASRQTYETTANIAKLRDELADAQFLVEKQRDAIKQKVCLSLVVGCVCVQHKARITASPFP